MVGISSPGSRRGVLWSKYRKHFAKDGDRVVVWQAESAVMNPGLDAELIAGAHRRRRRPAHRHGVLRPPDAVDAAPYHIIDTDDLKRAAERAAAYRGRPSTVVPLAPSRTLPAHQPDSEAGPAAVNGRG